ncbi:MAG: hypothetical protein MOGMAGMI_01878 [Candidatus Omnitrophica bacterium]|nr:hypothetical protein [Candidatus Omnitrophota bacterium]
MPDCRSALVMTHSDDREHKMLLQLRDAHIAAVRAIEQYLDVPSSLGKSRAQRRHEEYIARKSPQELARKFDEIVGDHGVD